MSTPLIKLTKKDFESNQDVRWCPGCGDYAILATVQRTLAQLGVARETTTFISGIGCSSRFPYYMNTYGFHTIHGRAPAIATGLKMARPELDVWVVTGDGDGLSIGGNHLMHALRRNVGLKIMLFNNQIYGLTKGQYSPTSAVGTKAASTPMGSLDYPINPLALALAAGATFVARVADTDAKLMATVLQEAYHHQGSVFIEILQNCPVFNDGIWEAITDDAPGRQIVLRDGEPLLFAGGTKGVAIGQDFQAAVVDAKNPAVSMHRAHGTLGYAQMLASLTAAEFPVPVGVLYKVEKPSYEAMANSQVADAIAAKGRGKLEALLAEGMTWRVS
ncbi:MAG: 2-oxoacid:ferredoxin oxidoreductase subunit beta [Myxococcales bacterium]|nr:2-oxoacid:ferredoxin oxidoreductase subunit beta [Myxococcales bacterium]